MALGLANWHSHGYNDHNNKDDDSHDLQASPKDSRDQWDRDAREVRTFMSDVSQIVRLRGRQEGVEWFVGRSMHVPRKVVMKSCQVLDERDSPDKPGMMLEETLQKMVNRFDNLFNPGIDSSNKVASVIDHLKKHTARRRGAAIPKQGFLEWEQTSRIYELFSIDLNIFERIFFTIDVGKSGALFPKIVSFFLIGMIFISVVSWVIGTIPAYQHIPDRDPTSGAKCRNNVKAGECAPVPHQFFKVVEAVCVITFTLEYFLRLFTAHSVRKAFQNDDFLEAVLTGRSLPRRRSISSESWPDNPHEFDYPTKLDGKLKATIVHVFSPANMIDLLAITPFWLELFDIQGGGGFLVVLRILRLTRIFRIFKVGKYNDMFTLFTRVATQSIEALGLMIFFIMLGCCLFGTLIWFAEQGEWYPDGNALLSELSVPIVGRGAYLRHTGSKTDHDYEESPFQSIVHSAWFVIVTITTVGYGDVVPKTPEGQLIGAFTILNGIIVLAMPIGVVGANFSKEYYELVEDKKRRKRMQQQLATQEAVEEEQDAALMDVVGLSVTVHDDHVGDEIVRVDGKREELLRKAEMIDNTWREILPELTHQVLSRHLRFFLASFVGADGVQDAASSGGHMTKPRIHLSQLTDLDTLSTNVIKAISSSTSEDEGAEFGIKEALKVREEWHRFVESCWEYAAYLCRVEKALAPPEYFEMKAKIVSRPFRGRETMFHSEGTGLTCRSPLHSPQASDNVMRVPALAVNTTEKDEANFDARITLPTPPSQGPPRLGDTRKGKETMLVENASSLPGVVHHSSSEREGAR